MDVFRTPPVSEGDSSRVWCADAFRLSLVSVGRALARCGNAYIKKNDLEQAMIFFNKSMSEHRDPAVVKKALEVSELSKLVFTWLPSQLKLRTNASWWLDCQSQEDRNLNHKRSTVVVTDEPCDDDSRLSSDMNGVLRWFQPGELSVQAFGMVILLDELFESLHGVPCLSHCGRKWLNLPSMASHNRGHRGGRPKSNHE